MSAKLSAMLMVGGSLVFGLFLDTDHGFESLFDFGRQSREASREEKRITSYCRNAPPPSVVGNIREEQIATCIRVMPRIKVI